LAARAAPPHATSAHPLLPALVEAYGAQHAEERPNLQSPGPFPFQTASSTDGLLAIHYYHGGAGFAQQLISLAEHDLQHPIFDTLGLKLLRTAQIYIYASRADFLAGAPVSDATETAALTDPITNSIYLVSTAPFDDGATDSLPHELTHLVFHQNMDQGHLEGQLFTFFPLWLDEGLATYDEPSDATQVEDYQQSLESAVSTSHLVDLLQGFTFTYPSDPGVDFTAYSEARSFITYLISTYGSPAFHRFIAGIRNGGLQLAATTSFGASLNLLEYRWEASLGYTVTGRALGYSPLYIPPIPVLVLPMPASADLARPYPLPWSPGLAAGWTVLALAILLLSTLLMWRSAATDVRVRKQLVLAQTRSGASNPPEWRYSADLVPLGGYYYEPPAPAALAPEATAAFARKWKRAHNYWLEPCLLAGGLLIAAGAGYAFVRLPAVVPSWQVGYYVAGAVAVPFALALIWLALRGGFPTYVPLYRVTGLLCLLAFVGLALQQAPAAGRSQALLYEQRGDYRLALNYFAQVNLEASGARATDLERVHIEWGRQALGQGNYQTAEAQTEAALQLASPATSGDAQALMSLVGSLGLHLVISGAYKDAVQVYSALENSGDCPPACRQQVQSDTAEAYLAWADAELVSGDLKAAEATLQIISSRYTTTSQSSIAARAEPEVAAQQLLESALVMGSSGNYSAMNRQLRTLSALYPRTVAGGIEAAQVPEPVTGSVVDSSGGSTSGDLLFLLAFSSRSAAQGFTFDFAHDTSAFKVATWILPGGSFAARLPPGYWYVPVWDDPNWASDSYFNSSESTTNGAFTVAPYTPQSVGVIVGF
jgi:hypothetical protein